MAANKIPARDVDTNEMESEKYSAQIASNMQYPLAEEIRLEFNFIDTDKVLLGPEFNSISKRVSIKNLVFKIIEWKFR